MQDLLKTNKTNEYSVKLPDTREHTKIIAFPNASSNQLGTHTHTHAEFFLEKPARYLEMNFRT